MIRSNTIKASRQGQEPTVERGDSLNINFIAERWHKPNDCSPRAEEDTMLQSFREIQAKMRHWTILSSALKKPRHC